MHRPGSVQVPQGVRTERHRPLHGARVLCGRLQAERALRAGPLRVRSGLQLARRVARVPAGVRLLRRRGRVHARHDPVHVLGQLRGAGGGDEGYVIYNCCNNTNASCHHY